MKNSANLYQPIENSVVGGAPLLIKTIVTENKNSIMGGVPLANKKSEFYVSLSALPEELRRRVELAIQAINPI
jgi:hypothetical protein